MVPIIGEDENKKRFDKAQLYVSRGLRVVPDHSRLLRLQMEVRIQKETWLAAKKRENMQALPSRGAQPIAEDTRRSTEADPESAGFLGTLKKLFTDGNVQSPGGLFHH